MTNFFTELQCDLLIGTLLGEGHLQTVMQKATWRYQAAHGNSQKDYLFFKYHILQKFCKAIPRRTVYLDKCFNKEHIFWRFQTVALKKLAGIGQAFYFYDSSTKFVKNVPFNIESFLTPRAFAFWFMDDGSLKKLGKFIKLERLPIILMGLLFLRILFL